MLQYNHDLLVLFDIDGTLVRRAGPHHREALTTAVRIVTGLETTTNGIPVHGMLDTDILTQMMLKRGLSAQCIEQRMPAILREAELAYEATCPDLRDRTCPGARRFLNVLIRNRVPCALVTGNLARIGWKKLACAGLDRYFLFGSFAGTAHTRAALARNAISIARRRGYVRSETKIWLIGDAPQDVLAARENRIRCAAVHTGVSESRELGSLRPTLLLRNLTTLTVDELLQN